MCDRRLVCDATILCRGMDLGRQGTVSHSVVSTTYAEGRKVSSLLSQARAAVQSNWIGSGCESASVLVYLVLIESCKRSGKHGPRRRTDGAPIHKCIADRCCVHRIVARVSMYSFHGKREFRGAPYGTYGVAQRQRKRVLASTPRKARSVGLEAFLGSFG